MLVAGRAETIALLVPVIMSANYASQDTMVNTVSISALLVALPQHVTKTMEVVVAQTGFLEIGVTCVVFLTMVNSAKRIVLRTAKTLIVTDTMEHVWNVNQVLYLEIIAKFA